MKNILCSSQLESLFWAFDGEELFSTYTHILKVSSNWFLKLRRAVYNFVRTHEELKRTPADAAGIDIGLPRSRFLDLIKVCSVPP